MLSKTPKGLEGSIKSPEPTVVGACRSAVAVHVASRRWLRHAAGFRKFESWITTEDQTNETIGGAGRGVEKGGAIFVGEIFLVVLTIKACRYFSAADLMASSPAKTSRARNHAGRFAS
jgi:hypothetical protein